MTRSAWKLPYIHRLFLSHRFAQGKYFHIWLRDSVISPFFFNKSFNIYNGSHFVSFVVTQDMIGRKFGEFSVTKALGFRETKKNSKKRATKFRNKKK